MTYKYLSIARKLNDTWIVSFFLPAIQRSNSEKEKHPVTLCLFDCAVIVNRVILAISFL